MAVKKASVECRNCGSNNLVQKGEFFVCQYCNSSFHRAVFYPDEEYFSIEEDYQDSLQRARVYIQLKKTKDAIAEYEYLINHYPYRYEAYERLIRLLSRNFSLFKSFSVKEETYVIFTDDVENYDKRLKDKHASLKRVVERVKKLFSDMLSILSDASKAYLSSFILQTRGFIKNGMNILACFGNAIQSRSQCIRLINRRNLLNGKIKYYEDVISSLEHNYADIPKYRVIGRKVISLEKEAFFKYRQKVNMSIDSLQQALADLSFRRIKRVALNVAESLGCVLGSSVGARFLMARIANLEKVQFDSQTEDWGFLFFFSILLVLLSLFMIGPIINSVKLKDAYKYFGEYLSKQREKISEYQSSKAETQIKLQKVLQDLQAMPYKFS